MLMLIGMCFEIVFEEPKDNECGVLISYLFSGEEKLRGEILFVASSELRVMVWSAIHGGSYSVHKLLQCFAVKRERIAR